MSDVAKLTIKVSTDVSKAARDLAALDAGLRRVADSGGRAGESIRGLNNNTDDTSRGMRDAAAATDRNARAVDGLSNSSRKSNLDMRSLLISLAIVAGTSLAPVAGASAGALLALGGVVTSVGLGLGVFGLALEAIGKNKDGTLVAFNGIKDALTAWGKAEAKITMKPIEAFTKILPGALTMLNPMLLATSNALTKGVVALGGWLKSKEAATNMKALTAAFTPMATNLGAALGNFLRGLVNLFVAFLPTSVRMTGGIKSLSDTFLRWSQTLDKNQGFQKFVAFVNTEGPKVWGYLGTITSALIKFIAALVPFGSIVLTGLVNFIADIGKLDPAIIQAIAFAVSSLILAFKGAQIIQAVAVALGAVSSVVLAIGAVILAVGIAFVILFQKCQPFHDFVMNKLLPGLKSLWNLIWSNLKPALDAIWAAIQTHVVPALESLWSSVQKAWKNMQPFVQLVERIYKVELLGWKTVLTEVVIPALGLLIAAIGTVIRWLSEIVGALSTVANYLIDHFQGAVKTVTGAFTTAWNNVYKAFQTAVRNIVNTFLGLVGTIINGAAKAFGWVPGIGGKLKKAAKSFDQFKSDVNASLGGIKPKTVPVTVSFNGVPEGKITGHTYTSTTGFSYATGGHVRGPGSGTSDDIHASLSNGEYVVNARATARNRYLLDRMNNGRMGYASGGAVGGGLGGLGGAAQTDGKLALKMDIDKQTTSLSSAYAKANNTFISQQTKALAGAGGHIPSGAQLALLVKAMGITGVPKTWAGPLNTLITRESGWNPNAINLTDSNAQAGHPSQGLMQTIPSTFGAYRDPSLSGSITDPLANVVAGINYIKAVYGSIFNVQQAVGATPKGYALGGVAKGPSIVGENGPEIIDAGSGSKVYSNRESQKMLAGSGGGDVHVNYYGTVYQGSDEDAAKVAFKVRTHGMGWLTR